MASTIVPKPEIDEKTFDSTLQSADSSMIFSETLSLAMDSFCANKARFLLTMLGMVIGSASIILVVTVGLTGKHTRWTRVPAWGRIRSRCSTAAEA